MRKFTRVARVALSVAVALARIGPALVGLSLAQRRAIRAFSRELRRQGLPEDIAEQLAADYPTFRDLSPKKLNIGGFRRKT